MLKDTSTNTVIFTVQQTLGVILNNSSVGNTDGGTNDLLTKSNTFTGAAKEIQFDNYVWNTGQATDSYNLNITKVQMSQVVQSHAYTSPMGVLY